MHFDWSINFGNLATFAAFIMALWGAYQRTVEHTQSYHLENVTRLTRLETNVDMLLQMAREQRTRGEYDRFPGDR